MKAVNRTSLHRVIYAGSAICVVAAGLIWRSQFLPLSPFLKKYGGDTLWALLVLVLIRFVQPRMNLAISSLAAMGVAAAVEFSQLYHAPWIEGIRNTKVGSLILGSTFNWPDIPAYALGIVVGALLDWGLSAKGAKSLG